MNNHTTPIIALFILMFMNSCGLLKQAPEETYYFPDDDFQFTPMTFDTNDTISVITTFASIEKQNCYGICPEYSAIFYNDGRIELDGKQGIKWIGKHVSRIDLATVEQIKMLAEQVDYFRLANYYPIDGATIDEVPGTVTSVDLIYKSNTVTNKHHSPAKLHRFERFLEEIIFRQNWELSQIEN